MEDDQELSDFVQDDAESSEDDWEGKVSRAYEQHRSSAKNLRPQSANRGDDRPSSALPADSENQRRGSSNSRRPSGAGSVSSGIERDRRNSSGTDRESLRDSSSSSRPKPSASSNSFSDRLYSSGRDSSARDGGTTSDNHGNYGNSSNSNYGSSKLASSATSYPSMLSGGPNLSGMKSFGNFGSTSDSSMGHGGFGGLGGSGGLANTLGRHGLSSAGGGLGRSFLYNPATGSETGSNAGGDRNNDLKQENSRADTVNTETQMPLLERPANPQSIRWSGGGLSMGSSLGLSKPGSSGGIGGTYGNGGMGGMKSSGSGGSVLGSTIGQGRNNMNNTYGSGLGSTLGRGGSGASLGGTRPATSSGGNRADDVVNRAANLSTTPTHSQNKPRPKSAQQHLREQQKLSEKKKFDFEKSMKTCQAEADYKLLYRISEMNEWCRALKFNTRYRVVYIDDEKTPGGRKLVIQLFRGEEFEEEVSYLILGKRYKSLQSKFNDSQAASGPAPPDPKSGAEKIRRKRIDREIAEERQKTRYELPDNDESKYNGIKLTKDQQHMRKLEIRDAILLVKDLERGLSTQLGTLRQVRKTVKKDETKFNVMH